MIQNIYQEFRSRNLELLKQKMLILMNAQTALKSFLKKCYILIVDLEYPDELHQLHNDLLAPEKLAIPYDILSNYC